ncbi:MAG TPA: hypothetical protein VHK24_05620 [Steroidobacter sp.]|jgi:hypothetical protein|nr:hypothetical protein [Steroidobacter sp.]
MRHELPAPVAPDQYVGKPQGHFTVPALVRSLQILDARHRGSIAVQSEAAPGRGFVGFCNFPDANLEPSARHDQPICCIEGSVTGY